MLSIIAKENEKSIAVSVSGNTNKYECLAGFKAMCKIFYTTMSKEFDSNNEAEFKLAMIHLINELNLSE